MKVKQEILFTLALFPLELLMSNNKQKPKQSPVKVKAPSNYVGVPRKVRNYFLLEIYEDQKNSEWNSHQRERERLLSGPTKKHLGGVHLKWVF